MDMKKMGMKKNRANRVRIAVRLAVVAMFFVAVNFVAALVSTPAQAKFGVLGGYKYISISDRNLGYEAHVFQLDVMSTVGGGYRAGGKRPRHAFGMALAAGGGGEAEIGGKGSADTVYFAIPFVYEHVFPFGLGLSLGVSIPFYVAIGSEGEGSSFLTGVSLSDLGVNYHFKNGWTLYARGNVGTASAVLGDLDDTYLAWGVGLGGGLWF